MTSPKKSKDAEGVEQSATSQEELQAAYQIHTLVQRIHGQMAFPQPFEPQPFPMVGCGATGWGPPLASGVSPTWPRSEFWPA